MLISLHKDNGLILSKGENSLKKHIHVRKNDVCKIKTIFYKKHYSAKLSNKIYDNLHKN